MSPSKFEGPGLSDMSYVTRVDADSSIMPMGAAWASEPGGRYWGYGSNKSSRQDYLDRGVLNYSLMCHFFSRVENFCVESYK